jgi:hypothetical protein
MADPVVHTAKQLTKQTATVSVNVPRSIDGKKNAQSNKAHTHAYRLKSSSIKTRRVVPATLFAAALSLLWFFLLFSNDRDTGPLLSTRNKPYRAAVGAIQESDTIRTTDFMTLMEDGEWWRSDR